MSSAKKREIFKDFLSKNKVLLVDTSTASRRRLVKTLVNMGCGRSDIFPVAHYSEALDVFRREKPKLILSDYTIQGGSGFDLFKDCREEGVKSDDAILVLITANISQSLVAKAAEEDVDSYIIKPYTIQSLENSLVTAVVGKLRPSKYIQTIEDGKKKLFSGDYRTSLNIFTTAVEMSKTPSLAHFYAGQAQYLLKSVENARKDYKSGLAINKIHFKCQSGLFELCMKQKRFKEAYDVVKNIARYFPANPERLKQVVRLAVMTQNYDDLIDYYEIFTSLDERPPEVVNYICSGLYVLGRFKFFQGDKVSGKETYKKLLVSCMGEAKFVKAVVVQFVERGMFSDAREAMKRFGAGSEGSEAHDISKYLATFDEMTVTERVSYGLELFNKGYRDPLATKFMIQSLKEAGSSKASFYLEEASVLWPREFKRESFANA